MLALDEHEQALIERASKHFEYRSLEISQVFDACESQTRDLVDHIHCKCTFKCYII